jgi:hypothetical protein
VSSRRSLLLSSVSPWTWTDTDLAVAGSNGNAPNRRRRAVDVVPPPVARLLRARVEHGEGWVSATPTCTPSRPRCGASRRSGCWASRRCAPTASSSAAPACGLLYGGYWRIQIDAQETRPAFPGSGACCGSKSLTDYARWLLCSGRGRWGAGGAHGGPVPRRRRGPLLQAAGC